MGLLFTGLYGAMAFPVRYYLRRRPLVERCPEIPAIVGNDLHCRGWRRAHGHEQGLSGGIACSWNSWRCSALAWVGFTLVAFAVYGVLAGQRAIRSFQVEHKEALSPCHFPKLPPTSRWSPRGSDRVAHHRRDPAWLDAAFTSDPCSVLLMREGLLLVEGSALPAAPLPIGAALPPGRPILWLGPQAGMLSPKATRVFLGETT